MNLYPILTPWAPPKSGQPFPPPPQRSDPNPTECFYPMEEPARLQLTVTPSRVSTRLMWPYLCLLINDI